MLVRIELSASNNVIDLYDFVCILGQNEIRLFRMSLVFIYSFFVEASILQNIRYKDARTKRTKNMF